MQLTDFPGPARAMPRWLRCVAAASLLAAMAAASTAQPAREPAVVEVQWGDSFSSIAARYTGSLRTWRQLYSPQRSGLPNPDRIGVGMRLELVTEDSGARYLRVVSVPGIQAVAPRSARVAAIATVPSATVVPVPSVAVVPAPAATAAALAMAAVGSAAAAAGGEDTLVIGVLPNIGAQALLAQYDNLKRYLERVGPQKVRIVLPANFKAFFDSTLRGDFDLAVAAPHFARVAQLERGMLPLVMFEPRINALLIAPADTRIAEAADVRGKAVAFANPTSLVAMYGVQWLQQRRLEAGRDFEVRAARSDMGVGRMLLSGEAAAAVMSNGEMRALPADESARLKVVDVFARIPNFIVLAHPRLPRGRVDQLRTQLKDFLISHEEGLAFGRATGFTGIVDADDAVLRELDPYVGLTRRAMGHGG